MTSHVYFYTSESEPESEPKPEKKRSKKRSLSALHEQQSETALHCKESTEDTLFEGISEVAEPAATSAVSGAPMSKRQKRDPVLNNSLLTVQQAAVLLQVHPETVREMVRRGELRKVPIGSRNYRIARSEIDRFIAEREMLGSAS